MTQTLTDLREERIQKLFADCRKQVIGQIIGPFGLSTAMFEDRNGGNVTTCHNFEKADASYMATDTDRALQAHSRTSYSVEIRSGLEIDTKTKAASAGGKTWDDKRQEKIGEGRDEYTGKPVSPDGTMQLGDRIVDAELDHVVSIKEVHENARNHFSLGQVGEDGAVDVSRLRELVNDDANLALTNQPLNGSKGGDDLAEWAARDRRDGTTNAEKYGVDDELMKAKYEQARKHIETTADHALLKKQATELLQTGGRQAMQMGLRQALGLLLTELVNGLFNEVKVLIQHGVTAGKTLFAEVRERLARVIAATVRKIPDAVSQLFQGGVSGFMSNLLTFVLNNFFSTAKRFVTVIREGLLGLFGAFKMIFFPPAGMTGDQALQEGLKLLTAVVVSSVGLLLNESVSAFMATLPFLKPFADLVTPVLIGIMSGLLSAFLAYQIDCLFDRYRHSMTEKLMDELIADSKRRDVFATELVALSDSSLGNIEGYSKSIGLYREVGLVLGAASTTAAAVLTSLEQTVAETRAQVADSIAMVGFINDSQSDIEQFLKTL